MAIVPDKLPSANNDVPLVSNGNSFDKVLFGVSRYIRGTDICCITEHKYFCVQPFTRKKSNSAL